MINPFFKKKMETETSGFNFADMVSLECLVRGMRIEKRILQAKVMGKVKSANAYVVNIFGLDIYYPAEQYDRRYNTISSLKRKYGYPIRQIELEWGKFSGSINEFIIPEHELKKIEA
jgi:hypothetical protein